MNGPPKTNPIRKKGQIIFQKLFTMRNEFFLVGLMLKISVAGEAEEEKSIYGESYEYMSK